MRDSQAGYVRKPGKLLFLNGFVVYVYKYYAQFERGIASKIYSFAENGLAPHDA